MGSEMCIRDRQYTDLLQALKGERLSSVFSPDGTLISASAAPHCGVTSGPKETFIKRYIVQRTYKAELRPEEQSEKAELSGEFVK